ADSVGGPASHIDRAGWRGQIPDAKHRETSAMSQPPISQTRHVLIRGEVQGVGYRAWAQHQAQLHGIKGWVRNRRDGAVEALLAGDEQALAIMLKTMAEGPRGAQVSSIEEVAGEDPGHTGKGFEIRETA